jgi:8-oxo-dGTP pyrophosphatase MutT (NUDIX family)
VSGSATVLLTDTQGRLLAVSRGADTSDWGMPGGWLEPGEDPAQGAARELWEETGILVAPEHLEPIYRQAGCTTFTPRGPIYVPPTLYSEPFEGYVAWVEPSAIACASCTFGRTNGKMLRDLGLL